MIWLTVSMNRSANWGNNGSYNFKKVLISIFSSKRSKRAKKVQPKLEFQEEAEPYYMPDQETYEETDDNPLELDESQLDEAQLDETNMEEQDYNMSQNEIDDYNSCTTSKDQDEAFLQSILPILKRLPKKKNILARLKIQQILFELEFDDKYCSNMQ